MPTNPFTSTSNRRQQILVPKELFPKNAASLVNGGVDLSSLLSSSSSYRRPVKLPLRKHHSFHFQSSQTVAGSGALKHEQFQPSKQTSSASAKHQQQTLTKDRYKKQGPLVFKPFSEKSAFKPIAPSKSGGDDASLLNGYDASTMPPRICGTSLKRHISNVETFSTAVNQWHQSDADGDDDDDDNTIQNSTATIAMGDINRRRIHYADLDLVLPTSSSSHVYQRNDRNNNSDNNIDSSSSGGGSGSGSDRHTSANNDVPNNAKDHKSMNNIQHPQNTAAATAGQATTTQYATLRFDEVSI